MNPPADIDPSPPVGKPSSGFWMKLPALVALLLCTILGLLILRWNPGDIAKKYQAISQNALDAKDYPTAFVASHRLLSFGGPWRNEALFKLAQANLGLARNSEVAGLMDLVAPMDKPVYAPAHLFVARMLMSKPYPSARAVQVSIAQLNNVLKLEPDSREAKELLERCHREAGDGWSGSGAK